MTSFFCYAQIKAVLIFNVKKRNLLLQLQKAKRNFLRDSKKRGLHNNKNNNNNNNNRSYNNNRSNNNNNQKKEGLSIFLKKKNPSLAFVD